MATYGGPAESLRRCGYTLNPLETTLGHYLWIRGDYGRGEPILIGIGTGGKCRPTCAVYNSTISTFAPGLEEVTNLVAAFHQEKPPSLNLPVE